MRCEKLNRCSTGRLASEALNGSLLLVRSDIIHVGEQRAMTLQSEVEQLRKGGASPLLLIALAFALAFAVGLAVRELFD